jgi:hypothetical protein
MMSDTGVKESFKFGAAPMTPAMLSRRAIARRRAVLVLQQHFVILRSEATKNLGLARWCRNGGFATLPCINRPGALLPR